MDWMWIVVAVLTLFLVGYVVKSVLSAFTTLHIDLVDFFKAGNSQASITHFLHECYARQVQLIKWTLRRQLEERIRSTSDAATCIIFHTAQRMLEDENWRWDILRNITLVIKRSPPFIHIETERTLRIWSDSDESDIVNLDTNDLSSNLLDEFWNLKKAYHSLIE